MARQAAASEGAREQSRVLSMRVGGANRNQASADVRITVHIRRI